jgi:RNA polymerase sigma factor (sigma-70 family)
MKRLKVTPTADKREGVSVVPASRVQVSRLKIRPQGQAEVEIYPLVLRLVKRCYKGIAEDGRLEYQDLISEGVLAVLECLRRYKPPKGKKPVKFSTFAFFRIVGALKDAVKKQDKYGVKMQLVAGDEFDQQVSRPSYLELDVSNRQLFLKVIGIIEKKLPPTLAVVLIRSYLEEWPDRTIAKELGVTLVQLELLREKALAGVRHQLPISRKQFGTWVG